MHAHQTLRTTILGCGASGGVPRANGDWGACDPNDARNVRTRCGLLLRLWEGEPTGNDDATTVIIDAPPELRQQLIAQKTRRLDGVVFSHSHADQVHGLDDVRPFAQSRRAPVPAFADRTTAGLMLARFDYAFVGVDGYPPIMTMQSAMTAGEPIVIEGPGGPMALTPLLQDHGFMESFGFRIGRFAYNNDVVRLPEATLQALSDLDVWIVDALRYAPHPSHAHVAQALAWVERLRPKQTVLTNLHIDLDYATLAAQLPASVRPAHDGLTFDLVGDFT